MLQKIMNNSIVTFVLGIIAGYFLEKVLDFIGDIFKNIPQKWNQHQQKKYDKTVQSADFIKFQDDILKKYYGEEFFTSVFDRTYPVFCRGGKATYPFESLCKEAFGEDKKLNFKGNTLYRKYKRVMAGRIKRPKMQGFMLDRFVLDDHQITGMQTWVGTYDENVYTSHILEYELFRAYQTYKRTNVYDLSSLKFRNAIHNGLTKEEVLTTGANRASLLGVQMLIVFLDRETQQYQVLVIKRSNDVAAKPGFYQFVPSGGFEVFENSEEHTPKELEANYKVLRAIYREYLEELIAGKAEDYEYGHGGETVSAIEKASAVKDLKNYISEGTAHFEFLGSVVDLCSLRNELSFVLKIDDVRYSDQIFNSNSESKKINRIPIDKLEQAIDVQKINPASAALWKLFTQNHLFDDCHKQQYQNKTSN